MTDDLLDVVDAGGSAEAVVYGRRVDPFSDAPKCQHRTFGLDGFSAVINDDNGVLERREVRVRVRCMECGIPCAIDIDAVRRPKDGEPHGIVLVVAPMDPG